MIRSLRRRHATIIGGIALVVPILALLALALRPSPPIMASATPTTPTENWTTLDPGGGVHALVESESGTEWLHLVRDVEFVAPDVLVYWSPEALDEDEPLPSSTVLLGSLGDPGAHTFNLPARDVSGILLLYSLAHQSIVATTPIQQIRRLDHGR